ncbi:MAG: hypothetical protein LBU44_04420 [Mediterranea sp.]|nr:hypothetical protein [Mediterranea sp.]
MKELKVKKISVNTVEADAVPALLNKENVAFEPLDVVNWAEFPYRPEVSFRIAYTDSAVLLHYKVKENSVRALYGQANEPVYKDACVEFFIIPAADEIYYNVECNCIGTILLGGGKPGDRGYADPSIIRLIDRWASLGSVPFEERIGETAWEVALVIPFKVFFKHDLTSLDGKTARANFYKCGDDLSTPHFISWNPIHVDKPSFHRPEYFGKLAF